MKAGNLKGALLEYIVRQLLKSCGFTNVKADNLFSFERGGLFFINGRGAAHDADIIMNPPIQMPFAYPSQLLFECKAYGTITSLSIVRNAAGLRNDINEFEVVTRDSLRERQNNRRAAYAVDTRKRFLYQVGVAAVNDFTKPSVEYATNNKIPLLSLSWFLSPSIIRDFNSINQTLINSFDPKDMQNLYDFLKDREGNMHSVQYRRVYNFLSSDNIFGDIITFANTTINYSYVGLLETGDMVFLFARSRSEDNILNQLNRFNALKAEIHWFSDRPNVWRLTVYNSRNSDHQTDFDFYVPKRIFNHWKTFNLDKIAALDIKQEFFSRIFVFNQQNNPEVPFSIINIDREWLAQIRNNENEIN
ncbi:hypothetical protein [Sphingobacterium sp. UBA6320]|uniref:hypothetical protein n=1 Tax=Sphingobacterium sp. UBA6320 TaxID=1947510 RepID=UPI0025F09E27|nr:hypothetical protein [Sphingobacterium sp. UBA6320]